MNDILTRYERNPIIASADVPFECHAVYNAGAARYAGDYVLLLRCMGADGRSSFGLAVSRDGYNFEVRPEPVMVPAEEAPFAAAEERGIEDPRVTRIGDTYHIFYSAFSRRGFQIGLARTRDFVEFERVALTTAVDYRNSVLFPEKIGGRYVRFERPNCGPAPGIWISYSSDLIHWGGQELIMAPRGGSVWEDMKIGPGAPPIRTERGWLNIYHGVTPTMNGCVYRLGVAVHDLEDPRRVIGRARGFILAPREPYELLGYVPNVVFTCGAVPEEDGSIKIYYGGADQCMNVCTGSIDDLVEAALADGPDDSL